MQVEPIHHIDSNSTKLFALALSQAGLFTSIQAEECGYTPQNHHYHVKKGQWIREIRGVYFMRPITPTPETQYWLWYLWSRDREGATQGVFSHYTALSLHGLTDVNPDKIEMTVPKSFRKGSEIPKILTLHKKSLNEIEIQSMNGFKVTTPLATLVMLAEEGETPDEILEQGVKEGLKKGMLIKADLKKNPILARYAL